MEWSAVSKRYDFEPLNVCPEIHRIFPSVIMAESHRICQLKGLAGGGELVGLTLPGTADANSFASDVIKPHTPRQIRKERLFGLL